MCYLDYISLKSMHSNVSLTDEPKNPIIHQTAALVCLPLLGAVVVLLNAIPLAVYISSGRRNRQFSTGLIWLLVADILIGCFPLPIYGLKKYEFSDTNIAWKICDAWRYTYFTCIHIAMISLILITLERIGYLKFSLMYNVYFTKFRINLTFTLCWIFFIFFDMIPFFPIDEHDHEFCRYVIKKTWGFAMDILTKVFPLVFILASYSFMIYIAYKQTVKVRRCNTRKRRRASVINNIKIAIEMKATRTVAYIVGSYITCWAPSMIYYFLEWFCDMCEIEQPHRTWFRFFLKLLVLFHAFLTPIVFCWRNTEFWKSLRHFMKKSRRTQREVSMSTFYVSAFISRTRQRKKTSVTQNNEQGTSV